MYVMHDLGGLTQKKKQKQCGTEGKNHGGMVKHERVDSCDRAIAQGRADSLRIRREKHLGLWAVPWGITGRCNYMALEETNNKDGKVVDAKVRCATRTAEGETGMIYKRGDFGVSVSQIDGFGKNPSLWIHYKNNAFKVASFKNEENVKLFISHLEWLLFDDAKPPKEE